MGAGPLTAGPRTVSPDESAEVEALTCVCLSLLLWETEMGIVSCDRASETR